MVFQTKSMILVLINIVIVIIIVVVVMIGKESTLFMIDEANFSLSKYFFIVI
jgi:hypothetical protein